MKSPDIPQYELAPEARPVDAYINPVDYQVQRAPSGPRQTPQVKPITTVGQNSVGSYQGYNQAEQLASSLAKFNPQVIEAMKTGGVMLASKIMDDSHKEAVAAAQKAEALLDAQTELSSSDRSGANRKLAAQDPKAGWLMHALNPYRSWGWQRGMAYSMGQKLKQELPRLAEQLTANDYMAEDNGMGRLVELRNAKFAELQQVYGVDENTPSYQNYVLEPFNKGSDALTTKVTNDRVKWMDDNQPRVVANNLGQLIQTSVTNGTVESTLPDGTVVTSSGAMLAPALRQEANRLLESHGSMAGLPGQRTKWNAAAYKDLVARPEFAPGTANRRMLDSLTSTIPALGMGGKQEKDRYGNPMWLTFGEAFEKEAGQVEARVWANRQRQLTQYKQEASAFVGGLLEGATPGPGQATIALNALEAWGKQMAAQGKPVPDWMMAEIRKDLAGSIKDERELTDLDKDPMAGDRWELDFDKRAAEGTLDSYKIELERLQNAYEAMGSSAQGWYPAARRRLQQRFPNEMTIDAKYTDSKPALDGFVSEQLVAQYGTGNLSRTREAAKLRAKRLLEAKAYQVVGNALRQAEDDGVEMTKEKQMSIANTALDAWRDSEQGKKDMQDMFLRSRINPNAQALSTREAAEVIENPGPQSEQIDLPPRDDGRVAQDLSKFPVFGLDDLADAPASRARAYRNYAVLDVADLVTVVQGMLSGGGLPSPLKKFLRMNKGIQNPMDFIDAQMRLYPSYSWPFSQKQLETLRGNYRSSTALRTNAIATSRLQEQGMSNLARLNDWAYMA